MRQHLAGGVLLQVWRSNAALFMLSMSAGFAVGSGCILSSDRDMRAPDEFRVAITSSSDRPGEAGRLTIDALGRMRFEDWGAPCPGAAVVEEVWGRERVDSVYAVFRKNGFISLRQRYPDGEDGGFLSAPEKVTIEGMMRGTYQVVHVIRSDGAELPGSVRNILDWYFREVGHLRAKIAPDRH